MGRRLEEERVLGEPTRTVTWALFGVLPMGAGQLFCQLVLYQLEPKFHFFFKVKLYCPCHGNGSFRPRVVSALSRFGPESFRPWVVSAWVDSALGRFGPGSFRPNSVSRFGIFFLNYQACYRRST